MDLLTINWDILSNLSYKSTLGKSLKNTLRKVDKEALFEEINELISYMTEHGGEINHSYRVKSIQSCNLRYEKNFPTIEIEKTFNDVLGIRIIVNDYDLIGKIFIPKEVSIVDMKNGKIKDDGYRAVHMYYQKDHYHYPIEIQIMTEKDRLFNEWLHKYLYKYIFDSSVGVSLRNLYDNGFISSEEEFRKEMKKICAI